MRDARPVCAHPDPSTALALTPALTRSLTAPEAQPSPSYYTYGRCLFHHGIGFDDRRDPLSYKYEPTLCTAVRGGRRCPNGDMCSFAHNATEIRYHPLTLLRLMRAYNHRARQGLPSPVIPEILERAGIRMDDDGYVIHKFGAGRTWCTPTPCTFHYVHC